MLSLQKPEGASTSLFSNVFPDRSERISLTCDAFFWFNSIVTRLLVGFGYTLYSKFELTAVLPVLGSIVVRFKVTNPNLPC